MGKFKWVGTILTVAGLVVLAVQNTTPRLALVILGARTPVLPLAVWLLGAIALGALTAVVLITVTAPLSGAAPPSNRRRWQVKPEPSGPSRRPASSQGRLPGDGPPPTGPLLTLPLTHFQTEIAPILSPTKTGKIGASDRPLVSGKIGTAPPRANPRGRPVHSKTATASPSPSRGSV
jgi:hypothetical protein